MNQKETVGEEHEEEKEDSPRDEQAKAIHDERGNEKTEEMESDFRDKQRSNIANAADQEPNTERTNDGSSSTSQGDLALDGETDTMDDRVDDRDSPQNKSVPYSKDPK